MAFEKLWRYQLLFYKYAGYAPGKVRGSGSRVGALQAFKGLGFEVGPKESSDDSTRILASLIILLGCC